MGSEQKLEKRLAHVLLERHPDDAAPILESLKDEAAVPVLGETSKQIAAETLRRMASHRAASLLAGMDDAQAGPLFENLGLEQAAHVLRRMPGDRREALIAVLPERFARSLRTLLAFREGTAGAMMDPHVLALPGDVTVQEANARIRKSPEGVRYNIYVVDRANVLVGVLTLRELLLGGRNDRLEDISNHEVLSIHAEADRRSVLTHPAWRAAHSLPVVDDDGVYLGAVRYRTLRILEEELRRASAGEVSTSQALGDLFWTGMTGALGAMASAVARPDTSTDRP